MNPGMESRKIASRLVGPVRAWAGMVLAVALVLGIAPATRAGEPEYMLLTLEPGKALEIKGYWDTTGVFIATDLEPLPQPRRPKLRGELQAVDRKARTITVYGRTIHISDNTLFIADGDDEVTLESLKPGQRIEVSCKVKNDTLWMARKIRANGVKRSDKIKGTITAASVDGNPPDTIQIYQIRIILDRRTDVDEPSSHRSRMESEVLGDLSRPSPHGLPWGKVLNEHVHAAAEYRQEIESQDEYDLSPTFNADERTTQMDVRVRMLGYWAKHLRAEAQFRFRRRYVLAADRGTAPRELQAQVIRLNLLVKDFLTQGLAVQMGRQDFDEPREWLFDEYLDAVRVHYYAPEGWLFQAAFIYGGLSPVTPKYDTWTDLFALASWYPDPDNAITAWWLKRSDADVVRNREPVWWGLRYRGELKRRLHPWLELAVMRGQDKGRSLRAWALDVGATFIARDLRFRPAATLAYAHGSGDRARGDGVDNRFRQTGYQDNVDRFGGIASFSYYGTILDPELSNISLWTVGLGVRPTPRSSVDLVYHKYAQDHPDDAVKGSDLIDPPARPNGFSTNLGWALDLIVGLPRLWERIDLTFILAWFNPGEAFTPWQENALLARLNTRFRF